MSAVLGCNRYVYTRKKLVYAIWRIFATLPVGHRSITWPNKVTILITSAAMMFKGLVVLSLSLCLLFTIREERSKVEPEKIEEEIK